MLQHLRSRHSRLFWSCSALTDYKSAFHERTTGPVKVDVCGYCGEHFRRNGRLGD